MLNDRNNKYDENEEGEYHFSDDEVSYDVDPETSNKTPPEIEPKENLLDRLMRSKRLLISVAVFIALVFIIYKLVAPSSQTVPPTDIIATNTAAPAARPPVAMAPPPLVHVPAQTPVSPPPAPQAAPATVAQPAMPAVIPVQPATTTAVPVQPTVSSPAPATTLPTPPVNVQVSSGNDQLVNQLEAEYAQKLNDFAAQNKALQDQVQVLNTRVSSMETEMGQLIQALTHPVAPTVTPPAATTPPPAPVTDPVPSPQPAQPADARVPYNVQAIIPGRAWLRADNGETVTVAEGDVLKDLGRVTKIDPYDGVVEVNTGSKVISISYGNGD